MSEENIYADRDIMQLDEDGGHYIRHVFRMTAEKLHSKSDIAAELGHRDKRISELEEALHNIVYSQECSGGGFHEKTAIWNIAMNALNA